VELCRLGTVKLRNCGSPGSLARFELPALRRFELITAPSRGHLNEFNQHLSKLESLDLSYLGDNFTEALARSAQSGHYLLQLTRLIAVAVDLTPHILQEAMGGSCSKLKVLNLTRTFVRADADIVSTPEQKLQVPEAAIKPNSVKPIQCNHSELALASVQFHYSRLCFRDSSGHLLFSSLFV